jgi:diacylglycerol kinase family enzyme
VFRGTHIHDPRLVLVRGRAVTFEADRPFVAYADGDPIAPLPATVRVAPRALRVLAP